jgi:murein DD-endopeptidase MepM/ murein hydrolase activator NlpD
MVWVLSFRRPDRVGLLFALVLSGGCAMLGPPPPPSRSPPGAWYVVGPGDTLASVAARHSVPLEDLAEVNGLSRGAPLAPGRMIFLLAAEPRALAMAPARSPAAPPPLSFSAGGAPSRPLPSDRSSGASLRWPLAEPRLSSAFGARQGRAHEGIDLAAPLGTPIHAAQAGQVLYSGDGVRGYGNMVVLRHSGDLLTVYAHTSVLLVRAGDRIAVGQEIARVGQSGRATAPHLHFEVRRGQVPQDPLRYLPPPPLASAAEKR